MIKDLIMEVWEHIAPYPPISDIDIQFAMQYIMKPVAETMIQENRKFVGVLYGGLMPTKQGIKVIEFNTRFGDPGTEVVLPSMQSDLVEIILSILEGKYIDIVWKKEAVLVGVVMAEEGYPNSYEKGFEIEGGEQDLVFHMGTQQKENKLIANGGRILMVVGIVDSLKEAKKLAYEKVSTIYSEGLFYRKDIGYKIIEY
ncbi:MAG: phosphoribosylglycinamide synthetase C domain-containing protein [Chitinophagaceae bacterium]